MSSAAWEINYEGEKMIRKFKILSVAAFAVLAVSALGASGAQASKFTADAYPTTVTAESAKGNDVFHTEAGDVECKSHFEGTLAKEASETLTVTAKYTECQAFGFVSATVEMKTCDYVFHTSGAVDVVCGTEPIKIVASSCTATVGGQPGLTTVELANGTADVTAKANVTGIAYTVTKDGLFCPFNGTGAKEGATYKQGTAVTVAATNGTTKVDIG